MVAFSGSAPAEQHIGLNKLARAALNLFFKRDWVCMQVDDGLPHVSHVVQVRVWRSRVREMAIRAARKRSGVQDEGAKDEVRGWDSGREQCKWQLNPVGATHRRGL